MSYTLSHLFSSAFSSSISSSFCRSLSLSLSSVSCFPFYHLFLAPHSLASSLGIIGNLDIITSCNGFPLGMCIFVHMCGLAIICQINSYFCYWNCDHKLMFIIQRFISQMGSRSPNSKLKLMCMLWWENRDAFGEVQPWPFDGFEFYVVWCSLLLFWVRMFLLQECGFLCNVISHSFAAAQHVEKICSLNLEWRCLLTSCMI